ncbi:MAG: hypothetical protein ABIU87_07530, partial [Ornithinibacter sp.]
HADEPDPWDTPDTPTPDAQTTDLLVDSSHADEPDPWDTPDTPTPDAQTTDLLVDSSHADEPDPWDTPAGGAEGAEDRAVDTPAELGVDPEAKIDLGTASNGDAGLTGDSALLNEPDPWD